MSDPALGLTMLGLIVIAIMMGFPTAFTLMGLGMIFGYIAFWAPGQHWYDNRIFDLIVQRTYGVMTNDTLLSIPLFVYMGYIMERAALIDRMFHSVQLAFRRVPASLAVTTMLVCAFWGIASGIVGAVVILVGVIAMRPMLNAGYDVRLASGVITAGGTLGILIPPSVMLIVYAAVAGQSIVKLYAAAMIPGFFLTFLYLVYILGWAIINPKIAPKLPPDQYRLTVPDYIKRLERGRSKRVIGGLIAAAFRPSMVKGATAVDGRTARYGLIVKDVLSAAVPVALTFATFSATWWYVLIYNAPAVTTAAVSVRRTVAVAPQTAPAEPQQPQALGTPQQMPQELGEAETEVKSSEPQQSADAPPEEMSSVTEPGVAGAGKVPAHFFEWFWGLAAFSVLVPHGRRAARDPEGALRLGGAARGAHRRGARGDPVRHLHRDRVGGGGCARGAVPCSDGEVSPAGLVVESCRRDRRRRARLGARGFCGVARVGIPRRHVLGDRRTCAHESQNLSGASAEHQASDVPHGEDDRDGLLVVRRLGALLRCVRAARRPGADRALGAEHEPLADGVPVHGADDYLPARLAARVDRDHHHLLPNLHPVAGPLSNRPDTVRYHGGGQSPGGISVAARRDVRVLSQGRGAEARHAQSNLRRHDALHGHCMHMPRLHVHLAGHDAVAAGVSVRQLTITRSSKRSSRPKRFKRLELFERLEPRA